MTQGITTMQGLTIGIDLGDRYSHYCVLDKDGEVLEEARLTTTPKAFQQRFGSAVACRIALEVGTHSPWVNQLLQEAGHEVLVANARKLRLIYQADNKHDRLDAQQLARVARMDPRLLSPIEHRSRRCRVDLAVLRSRDGLVTARTRLINHVRGCLKSFGMRIKKCSTRSFEKQALPHIPKELRPALVPVLRMVQDLNRKIRAYDKRMLKIAQQDYPETEALRQVNGVGPVTALTFVLTLEEPRRFKSSRSVGAFLGLRPRKRQSGGADPELRITKAGDRDLRRLLVQCAQYTLGPFGTDSDLRSWGLALAARGGKNAKKRALVATARKLAVLLHRLWMTGEVYEPQRRSGLRSRGQTDNKGSKACA